MSDDHVTTTRILKTVVALEDGDGTIFHMDTIEYQGRFWLVPAWLEAPSEGWKMPVRIICLDPLPHQKFPPGSGYGDFVLSGPLPKAALDAVAQPQLPVSYINSGRKVYH